MKPLPISLLPSLLLLSLSSAQSSNPAYFLLSGVASYPQRQNDASGNFTLTVPRDSHPIAITSPLQIVEITVVDSSGNVVRGTANNNCDFLGAQGVVTHFGTQLALDVDGPQAQVSVTCFGNATSSSSGAAAGTTVAATGMPTSSGPLYPTATGASSLTTGGAAASASVGSGTGNASAGTGSGTVIPFTGDAVKAAGSVGGAFFAFVLGIVAAAV